MQIQLVISCWTNVFKRPFILFSLELFHYLKLVGKIKTIAHDVWLKKNNIQCLLVISKQLKDSQYLGKHAN